MPGKRNWSAILYPESMDLSKMETPLLIDGVTGYCPLCYILHDKDIDPNDEDEKERKPHYHFFFAFPGPTTAKNVYEIANKFSADGLQCCPYVVPITSPRGMYDYMIHDTKDARKCNKHLYDKSERIEVGNFDIAAIEQITESEKKAALNILRHVINSKRYYNWIQLEKYLDGLDPDDQPLYLDVMIGYQNYLQKILNGWYPIVMADKKKDDERDHVHEGSGGGGNAKHIPGFRRD